MENPEAAIERISEKLMKQEVILLKGLDLYSVTMAFMQWGDKWLAAEEGQPLELYHKTCGHRLEPVITCRSGWAAVKTREVTYMDRLNQ